jgi:membrane fusion protein, multidrug efflux system
MQFRRWMLVVIICVGVTSTLAGIKYLQIRKAIAFAESFPEHSETVQAVTAQEMQWSPTINAMGEVKAPQSVKLRNELEGKIVKVGFKAGAQVVKGQLLVQLDVSHEQAQLRAAEAEAELATLELDRYQRLIKEKLASKEQYDRAKAQTAVAVAGVQALRATIDKKTLAAPFDAYAGLHDLEAGQYLASNTMITELVGVHNDVWIDFYLPQERAALNVGTQVSIKARGLLQAPLAGTVIAKDASVSSQSRNMRFRAVFQQASKQLKPGAIVEVTIPAAQTTTVTFLPLTAVRRNHFGANVYVLSSTGQSPAIRAENRAVTLGPVIKNNIIITSGVKPGERVAADGSYKLRDAMLVQLKDATPAQSSTEISAAVGTGHE